MSDWELVFATDELGVVESGSLNALRTAVMHAADVKVMYYTNGNWWSRYCASAAVRGSGNSTMVVATCLEAIDTEISGNNFVIAQPVALESHVYNSSGWRSRLTGTEIDSLQIKLRWFVRGYHTNFITLALAKAILVGP